MNDEYTDRLEKAFGGLKIEIVNFDNGAAPESMAAYILVSGLTKAMLKDKGSTVLDLGNYIHRKYGLQYEMCPEFHRSGEPKNSVAWYISKQRMDRQPHLKEWLLDVYNETADQPATRYESALYNGKRFTVNENR